MRSGPSETLMLLHKRGTPTLILPEFLKEVYLGRRTGLLHVTRDENEAVTFRSVNGEIVSGSSTAERGRLGETMVRRRLISRTDLERALAIMAREGRRLAPVLREMDLVDTPGLEEALAGHIREMLFTALRWDESSLLFEDQELPDAPAEDLTLRCSTAELIFELVRRIPERKLVRLALGDLDRAPVAGQGVPSRLNGGSIGPAEQYLLSRVDGRASARSMIEGAGLPPDDLERSLLGLLCTGLLRFATAPPPRLRKHH
ncbi:MAG: DUF4388 domain-containing protein [Acidobacteriota bacterium]